MTDVLRFESAREAVRNSYYKAVAASTALLCSSVGLYYGGKMMAQHYLRMAEANPEFVGTGDVMLVTASMLGGYIIGGMTLIGTPISLFSIRARSRVVTTIDKPNKRMYQSRKVPFEPDYAIEYNAITSVEVDRGPLEKRANTGSVVVRTLRLVSDQDEGARVEEDEVVIPYQNNPFEVRNKILEGLPTNKGLVARLRGN